jgi:hypothetical protein
MGNAPHLPDNNEPWVKDVAELQLALFNLMSAWFNGLNTQAFQKVLISATGLGETNKISISEYTWSFLPENAQVTIVPPSPQDGLVSAMGWTINQIYRVAFNRTRGLSDASQEAPGADTLREMNAELVSLLKIALTEMEGIVNRFLNHYAAFKGVENFEADIKFDADLSIEDLSKQIERFLAYRDEIRKILPWRKAHLKKVARQEDFGEEETQDIMQAIEDLPPEPSPKGLNSLVSLMTNDGQEDPVEAPSDATK